MNYEKIANRIQESVSARRIVSGMLDPPPAMVEDIYEWANAKTLINKIKSGRGRLLGLQTVIDSMLEGIDRNEKLGDFDAAETTKRRLKDYEEDLERAKKDDSKLVKELNGYKGRIVKKPWKRVAKKFKVDMRGWKYLKLIEEKAEEKRISYADSLFGVIKVELVEGDLRGNAKAYWDMSVPVLRVQTGGVLKTTIKHELRHWVQSYMSIALQTEFGKPSKSIQTPEFKQNMKLPSNLRQKMKQLGLKKEDIHDLDDVEFYTELADAVELFYLTKKQPGMKRVTDRKVFDHLVGRSGDAASKFFKRLQRGSKAKWQKAVKELAKAVL